jgi:hypothetical protein
MSSIRERAISLRLIPVYATSANIGWLPCGVSDLSQEVPERGG